MAVNSQNLCLATTTELTNVADAIREANTDASETLQWPDDFITAINGIVITPSIEVGDNTLIESGVAITNINKGDPVIIFGTSGSDYKFVSGVGRDLVYSYYYNGSVIYSTGYGYALKNMPMGNTNIKVIKTVGWAADLFNLP